MWKNLTDNIKQKTGLGGGHQAQHSGSSSGGAFPPRRPTVVGVKASPATAGGGGGGSAGTPSSGSNNSDFTSAINTDDWTEVLEEEDYIPAVELQDVLEDSPMLREKLHVLGQNVDVMAAKLKKILKVSRNYQIACKEMGQITEGFAHDLLTFNTGQASLQDPTLDDGLQRFGATFAECNEHYNLLAMQLESVFSQPMEAFVREDIREVKEEAKRYEKARALYDSTCSKAGQLKKKDASKIAEVEHELEMAKQQFQLQGMEFVYKMNELQLKKKIEFLERVCAFMFGQLSFFHTGYQMFSELEPYMRGLTVKLQQARSQFEEQKLNLQQQKKALTKFAAGPRQAKITEDSVELAGYLFKKRNNVLKEWVRYYFAIKDGFLYFYNDGKDPTPKKKESLLLFTVKPVDDPDRRFCFDIVSPTKTYSFQASSQVEMMEWIKVLQNSTAAMINAQRAVNKEGSASGNKDSQEPKGSALLAKLQEVDELNRYCVDCGARDPPWALINWGALICLECSGVHRSLGVQVSRVRSLTLDALDAETWMLMEKVGNKKANSIFEFWLPPGVEKPNPKSSRELREKFIKLKWTQKTFVEAASFNKEALDRALWHASWEDDVINLMRLVAQGGDVNFRDPENKTPLHAAVIEGNLVCVEFLIQSGANLNAVDNWSWTPLHYAVLHGKVKCALLLVKRNADTTIKDRNGNTPLSIAVMNQQADCVTLLRLTQLSLQETPGAQHKDSTSFAVALKEFQASLDKHLPQTSSTSPPLVPPTGGPPTSPGPPSRPTQPPPFATSSIPAPQTPMPLLPGKPQQPAAVAAAPVSTNPPSLPTPPLPTPPLSGNPSLPALPTPPSTLPTGAISRGGGSGSQIRRPPAVPPPLVPPSSNSLPSVQPPSPE